MELVLFSVFFILLFLRVPVAFCLGLSSFAYILASGNNLIDIVTKSYEGIDSFTLLCIPGFVLAGNLMNAGGITNRIIHFSNTLIGHIRGGLSHANICSSMLFAGISGTALADTASIGSIMIPAMKKEGYDAGYAAAVTASSSTVGPIIPPSLPMIIAGTLTGISVGKMFLAGAIPGLLIGFGMLLVSMTIAKKNSHPKGKKHSFAEIIEAFGKAFFALMLTVVILVGIFGSFFTVTEASIMAAIYAMLVGWLVYRELTFAKLIAAIQSTIITSASIMMLVAFAKVFAHILTAEQIPELIANLILSISDNKFVVLLLINILLLFVGMFMETIAALVILFPVLLAVVTPLGMDPVQFGVMMVLNLVIGLTTPPVGVCLFVASSIGKVSISQTTKQLLPFLFVSLFVLMLVAYVPFVSLALPSLFN